MQKRIRKRIPGMFIVNFVGEFSSVVVFCMSLLSIFMKYILIYFMKYGSRNDFDFRQITITYVTITYYSRRNNLEHP